MTGLSNAHRLPLASSRINNTNREEKRKKRRGERVGSGERGTNRTFL